LPPVDFEPEQEIWGAPKSKKLSKCCVKYWMGGSEDEEVEGFLPEVLLYTWQARAHLANSIKYRIELAYVEVRGTETQQNVEVL